MQLLNFILLDYSNYREAHGMYACNGILFNHESPRRGETFVTRKITRFCEYSSRFRRLLHMGNIDHYVIGGMQKIMQMQGLLQNDEPKDYVIATGKQYSVREFITWPQMLLN